MPPPAYAELAEKFEPVIESRPWKSWMPPPSPLAELPEIVELMTVSEPVDVSIPAPVQTWPSCRRSSSP